MAECRLFPRDLLALLHRRVTEAFNEAEEDFGEGRLVEALCTHCEQSPTNLLASVVDEGRRFSPHEQGDDITLIVARCKD
jgi:serine phosphatase RsbU (regulator of sigma subunit)